MQLKILKCPECRANLEIEEGSNFCFCQHCGCKIMLDNEKYETTINKNIDINKTNRHIDDAEIIRAKNEASRDSRNFKQVLVMLGLLFFIPIVISIGSYVNKAVSLHEGKISAGYYKDLIGENYTMVESHFEAAGFTNIELIDLDDSGILFWNKGKVEMISVGGDTNFESNDWFYPDTKVVISYH